MAADDREDALKKHRDLLIACGWGKEVDVILLFQQGASVRVQDQVNAVILLTLVSNPWHLELQLLHVFIRNCQFSR